MVSGNNGTWGHFALIVGYTGNGLNTEDYLVLDPLRSVDVPRTLKGFKDSFPYELVAGDGFRDPMYIFNSPQ